MNTGCVPTRVLAKTARLMREIRSAGIYGITTSRPELSWDETAAMTRKVIAEVRGRKNHPSRLEEAGVGLIEDEHARLTGEDAAVLEPSGRTVHFAAGRDLCGRPLPPAADPRPSTLCSPSTCWTRGRCPTA